MDRSFLDQNTTYVNKFIRTHRDEHFELSFSKITLLLKIMTGKTYFSEIRYVENDHKSFLNLKKRLS